MDKMSSFILTGGESLLGWQRLYIELFEHPRMKDLKNVTFHETNTTQTLHKDFEDYPPKQDRFQVTWSCSKTFPIMSLGTLLSSPKLLCPIVGFNSEMYFKFVVADATMLMKCLEQRPTVRWNQCSFITCHWEADQKSTNQHKNVPELAMARGWRYTPKTTCPLS